MCPKLNTFRMDLLHNIIIDIILLICACISETLDLMQNGTFSQLHMESPHATNGIGGNIKRVKRVCVRKLKKNQQ